MFENDIRQSIEGVELGEPLVRESLTIFPLIGGDRPGSNYLTLDEALRDGLAEVSETSEQGTVPELRFENKADIPILLVDGEELIGAKQNRVLNLTILVGAKAKVTIPVSCVEAGRWAFQHRRFSSSDRTMHARSRASKVSQVSDSLRTCFDRVSDQGTVWREIEEKQRRMGTSSPTSAMSASYEQFRVDIDQFVASMAPRERQRGAVFMINGAVAGIELFDKAQTYAKLAPKLVRSYAIEAIEFPANGGRPAAESADGWLERVAKLKIEAYPGTDLGTDLRLADNEMKGAALAADGAILHLEAFTKHWDMADLKAPVDEASRQRGRRHDARDGGHAA